MKTILITGASRGIGKAIALDLGKEGNTILVGYTNNKEMAEDVAKTIGNNSRAIYLEVTNQESINSVKKEEIDMLINNAAIFVQGNHKDIPPEELKRQTDINVNGVFLVTQAFLEQLNRKKGTIINISSVAPYYGPIGCIAYSATKAAVTNFTKGLANEYPNIKSYTISPGLTATDMTNHEGVPPEQVAQVLVKVLNKEIKMMSGNDVDVRDYF